MTELADYIKLIFLMLSRICLCYGSVMDLLSYIKTNVLL